MGTGKCSKRLVLGGLKPFWPVLNHPSFFLLVGCPKFPPCVKFRTTINLVSSNENLQQWVYFRTLVVKKRGDPPLYIVDKIITSSLRMKKIPTKHFQIQTHKKF